MRMTIFAVLAIASVSAKAALPSLSDLASNITTLRERIENATNETAQLRERVKAFSNIVERLEAVGNMNREARAAFHGGNPVSRIETNGTTRIIQRVDVYPDGYEFIVGAIGKHYTPEEMAEKVAARQRNKRSVDERIALLREQIENLEEVKNNGTNDLEAAYATIQIHAKRKSLARLEASKTNVVDVIVTP